jgi:fructose-bisphosphate aldolase class II
VAKVNWSSESLFARANAMREYFTRFGERIDARHPEFKKTAMDNGMNAFVAERYIPLVVERLGWLGSAGKAGACREAIAALSVKKGQA